ncbi:MAG TPA: serine hydrolase domain-containing protein [Vicinamibacterales bacterium]|nr:serine hydrolase domain-containing protein [Vicinamibacterales bacterium]
MPERFAAPAALLDEAVVARVFPAAAAEVGTRDGVHWSHAAGAHTFDPLAPLTTPRTIFDLASLTKVLATATLAMRAVDDGRLNLDDPVAGWINEWRGRERAHTTVRDLLAHCAGLPAYLPFYRDYTGRREFEHAICSLPLEYPPRSASVYSDLGFILLGFILEDAATPEAARRAGTFEPAASLDAQFNRLATFLTTEPLTFRPPRSWRPDTAPTEVDPWRGRLLAGEVHDENAWALGGVAGHAGLFGTAAAVGAFARAMLRTLAGERLLADPATARLFAQRDGVPGSSRALGWDTMLPTSSCGTRLTASAIGHTGFTGTSLWIDFERDLYVVLLTNRVHPTRENERIRAFRPRFHDAIVEAIESAG